MKWHPIVEFWIVTKGLASHSHSDFDTNRNSVSLLKYQREKKRSAEIFWCLIMDNLLLMASSLKWLWNNLCDKCKPCQNKEENKQARRSPKFLHYLLRYCCNWNLVWPLECWSQWLIRNYHQRKWPRAELILSSQTERVTGSNTCWKSKVKTMCRQKSAGQVTGTAQQLVQSDV